MQEDARKLSTQVQEEKRKQAIRLYKKSYQYKKIAELVGVHFETVGKWVRKYKARGLKGISSRARGRKLGEHRALLPEQEKKIQALIVDKSPDQLKMNYALWTRKAVKELIEKTLGIKLAIRTIGDYLSRWGITPQKPLKRAYEQSPAKVNHWLKEEYPEIKARAKREQAEICWGDEAGLRPEAQQGRSYALRGQMPVIELLAKRASSNMISAITNQGKVKFQVYRGSMNAARLIGFMKRLIKDAKRKVFFILDNFRVHHAKLFQAWLVANRDKIEVFYLPDYSPELNPDDFLNCDLKATKKVTK